jgi:hypothetical protein
MTSALQAGAASGQQQQQQRKFESGTLEASIRSLLGLWKLCSRLFTKPLTGHGLAHTLLHVVQLAAAVLMDGWQCRQQDAAEAAATSSSSSHGSSRHSSNRTNTSSDESLLDSLGSKGSSAQWFAVAAAEAVNVAQVVASAITREVSSSMAG